MRSSSAWSLGLTASLTLGACQKIELAAVEVPEPVPSHPVAAAQTRAGAAERRLSLPPGLPLAGHSLEGANGHGSWTPLWARALYLEDADGGRFAALVVDLWGVPAGFADAVHVRAQQRLRGLGHPGLDREELLIAATHTHHGPGNYASHRLYNAFAGPRHGFDRELFDSMVRDLTQTLVEAVLSAEPAQLRVTESAIPGWNRNRSMFAWERNPEASTLRSSTKSGPECAGPDPALRGELGEEAYAPDACRVAPPRLGLLVAQRPDGEAIGLLATYAAHPTAVANAVDLYHGDTFGIAAQRAGARLASSQDGDSGNERARVPVLLFNGAQGDLSQDWVRQEIREAERIGRGLGDAIFDAYTSLGEAAAPPIDLRIEHRFERVRMPEAPSPDGHAQHALARRALPGHSQAGGAEDGVTRLAKHYGEGHVRRSKRPVRRGQGPKRALIPPAIFALLYGRGATPELAPLSVHRLGPLHLIGLPGEFTSTLGSRIEAAAMEGVHEAGLDANWVWNLGLADEYLSYFTTAQEYSAQRYEGASMLWGEHAGSVMVAHARELSAQLGGDPPLSPPQLNYSPGPARRARPVHRAPRSLSEQLEQMHLRAKASASIHHRGLRGSSADSRRAWPELLVEMESDGSWIPARDAQGVPLTEAMGSFVRWHHSEDAQQRWELAWVLGEVTESGNTRLRLRARVEGQSYCSRAFQDEGAELGRMGSCQDDGRDSTRSLDAP